MISKSKSCLVIQPSSKSMCWALFSPYIDLYRR